MTLAPSKSHAHHLNPVEPNDEQFIHVKSYYERQCVQRKISPDDNVIKSFKKAFRHENRKTSFGSSLLKKLSFRKTMPDKKLSFKKQNLGDEHVEMICMCISNTEMKDMNLTKVVFQHNRINDKGAMAISSMLEENQSIAKLDLSFNLIT
jgi:hypothetical protein